MDATLQISDQTIYNWRKQDRIDSGLEPGLTSSDHPAVYIRKASAATVDFSPPVLP